MTEANTSFKGLGIEPTGDTRAVKRAYAAILKTIDLAKDPGLFAQLRSDYQAALDWAEALNNSVAAPHAAATNPAGAVTALTGTPGDVQLHTRVNGTSEGLDAFSDGDSDSDGDLASAARPVPIAQRGLSAPVRARRADAESSAGIDDIDAAERVAVGRLLDPNAPHRDRVLEEGLRRFGWDMHGTGANPNLELFGNASTWFMLLLLERQRWHELESEERLRFETLLARIASRAPSGELDAVGTWEALAAKVESFPLWTALVCGAEQIDVWHQAWAAVPKWKRKFLLNRKTLTIYSVACLVLAAILAVIFMTLNDDNAPEWAVALAHGAVPFIGMGAGLLVFALMVGRATKARLIRSLAGKPSPQSAPPFVMDNKKRAGLIIVAIPLIVIFSAFVIDHIAPVVGPRLTVVVVIGTGIAICALVAKVRSLRKNMQR